MVAERSGFTGAAEFGCRRHMCMRSTRREVDKKRAIRIFPNEVDHFPCKHGVDLVFLARFGESFRKILSFDAFEGHSGSASNKIMVFDKCTRGVIVV